MVILFTSGHGAQVFHHHSEAMFFVRGTSSASEGFGRRVGCHGWQRCVTIP